MKWRVSAITTTRQTISVEAPTSQLAVLAANELYTAKHDCFPGVPVVEESRFEAEPED